MRSGSAIRGTRIGSGPTRPTERCAPAPRRPATYWCGNGHVIEIQLAADVRPPDQWDCPHCGQPAGQDRQNPPPAVRVQPYKSHLAYVKERRSDADAETILAEALQALRQRRGR